MASGTLPPAGLGRRRTVPRPVSSAGRARPRASPWCPRWGSYTASSRAGAVDHAPTARRRRRPVVARRAPCRGRRRRRRRRRPRTGGVVTQGLRRGEQRPPARPRSSGRASSSVNEPTAVRRRSRRWRPATEGVAEVGGQRAHVGARRALDLGPHDAAGRRWASTVEAVDGDRAGARARPRCPRGPARAGACRPTFTAETIGGTCRMSPVSARGRRLDVGEGRRRPCRGWPSPRRRRRAWRSPPRARCRRCRSWAGR